MRKFPSIRCFHSLRTANTSEAVAKARPGVKGRQRVDIVSPDLCDDAIDLLKPSLEQYKGCRLLDFNPGSAVWSSRLHDVVKPTTHVFIDKAQDTYAPFWQPFFDDPASSYQHIRGDLFNLRLSPEFLNDVFREHPKPPQETNSIQDRDAETPLLVTANVALFSRAHLLGKYSTANLIASTRFQAHKLLTFLQRYAAANPSTPPPRLLLWTNDNDRHSFLPRVVSARKYDHVALEERWDVTEIVGDQKGASLGDRAGPEELLSALWTVQRMRATGVDLPPHRRSRMHAAAFADMFASQPPRQGSQSKGTNSGNSDPHSKAQYVNTPLMAKLQELQELWREASSEVEMADRPTTAAEKRGWFARQRQKRPNDKRIKELERHVNSILRGDSPPKQITLLDRLAMRHRVLNDLERKVARLRQEVSHSESQGSKKASKTLEVAEAQMAQVKEELAKISEGIQPGEQSHMRKLVDDFEVLVHREPPLLMWDQRPHEPLQAAENEFYPAEKSLALVSFTVKRPEDHSTYMPSNITAKSRPSKDIENVTASENSIFSTTTPHYLSNHPLVRDLLKSRGLTRSLPTILEAISHGSSSELIPKCPSLTDPLRGGHYDLESLRACALTLEHLRELVSAWNESPFHGTQEQPIVDDGKAELLSDTGS